MAARSLPLQTLLPIFQPIPSHTPQSILRLPVLQRIRLPPAAASALTIPLLGFAGISSILQELWDGLLRAVPKKKTSYSRKRHRQMAGKALKDVTTLVKCPSCGRPKRMHILCPYCVLAIKGFFKKETRAAAKAEAEVEAKAREEVREQVATQPRETVRARKRREARELGAPSGSPTNDPNPGRSGGLDMTA